MSYYFKNQEPKHRRRTLAFRLWSPPTRLQKRLASGALASIFSRLPLVNSCKATRTTTVEFLPDSKPLSVPSHCSRSPLSYTQQSSRLLLVTRTPCSFVSKRLYSIANFLVYHPLKSSKSLGRTNFTCAKSSLQLALLSLLCLVSFKVAWITWLIQFFLAMGISLMWWLDCGGKRTHSTISYSYMSSACHGYYHIDTECVWCPCIAAIARHVLKEDLGSFLPPWFTVSPNRDKKRFPNSSIGLQWLQTWVLECIGWSVRWKRNDRNNLL